MMTNELIAIAIITIIITTIYTLIILSCWEINTDALVL